VRQVGYLQELKRDARSTNQKILQITKFLVIKCPLTSTLFGPNVFLNLA